MKYDLHGKRYTNTYTKWANMKSRCQNKNDPRYKWYGGRGISICDEWQLFSGFYSDMGDPPTAKHSLDRIDNNKGYYKDNCRWTTHKEQCRNRSSNSLITYNGQTKSKTEWAEDYGLTYHQLKNRLSSGWAIEKALTTPLQGKTKGGLTRWEK